MEIGTGLALLGSAKLTEKLLGPTAEYIGEGIKYWSQRRVENINRIFEIAYSKLTTSDLNEDGNVNPKVLREVLDYGSYCDDDIAAEYVAGVLASSRGGNYADDRGAWFVKLISNLSSYQLRGHYIFYMILKNYGKPYSELNFGSDEDREKMITYLPIDYMIKALDLNEIDPQNEKAILNHMLFGLVRERLIGERFVMGAPEYLNKYLPQEVVGEGLAFVPSMPGAELMLWANNYKNTSAERFFDKDIVLKEVDGLDIDL